LVRVHLAGYVGSPGGIILSVSEWLVVRRGRSNRYEVKRQFCSYHAWRRANPRVDLVRYDTAHGGQLHRHRFDGEGREVAIEQMPVLAWPALDDVVREAVALAAPKT
jgi:hypothetical protein